MMNDPITFVVCLVIISLGIILFFKVWGMTNNVKKILLLMQNKEQKEKEGA